MRAITTHSVPTKLRNAEEYLPREWTRLVSRRLCLSSLDGHFEASLVDISGEKAVTERARFAFAIDDAGCGHWQTVDPALKANIPAARHATGLPS